VPPADAAWCSSDSDCWLVWVLLRQLPPNNKLLLLRLLLVLL
jgi:hypothetical protein